MGFMDGVKAAVGFVGGKASAEASAATKHGIENLNHVNNAANAGYEGQTAAQQGGRTAGQRIVETAVAVGSEMSPVVKAAAENRGKDAKTQACAVIGAAVGDVGSKVAGAAVGAAVTGGTSGVGVAGGIVAGQAVRMATEKPLAAAATWACNAVVDAATSEPAKKPAATAPAKPIQLTNVPIPGVDDAGVGRPAATGGSMADRLASLTGQNFTTVASNTENRTHHNPNAPTAPQSVVRVGAPSMAGP
jgi:hypothetical protein